MAEQRMVSAGQIECGAARRRPAKRSGKQTGTRRSQKQAYLFLLPSLVILTVFVFAPLIGAFGISLTDINIYMKGGSFVGLDNFRKAFHDSRVWNATLNTCVFTLFEVPLQVFLALFLLMFMMRNRRFDKFLRSVFYLPYVCSMTAISIVWSMLLDPNSGMLPYLLSKVGIQLPNLLGSPTWAMPTVIFVSVWKSFGYTLTILSAAALGVSPSLYESAELDGAGRWQQFFYVTIPEIRDSIGFCLVTTLITALQVFDQIYVMTGGGPLYKTETLVGYIYDRGFQTAPFNLGYASSIAVYLFLLIAVVTAVTRRYSFGQDDEL